MGFQEERSADVSKTVFPSTDCMKMNWLLTKKTEMGTFISTGVHFTPSTDWWFSRPMNKKRPLPNSTPDQGESPPAGTLAKDTLDQTIPSCECQISSGPMAVATNRPFPKSIEVICQAVSRCCVDQASPSD